MNISELPKISRVEQEIIRLQDLYLSYKGVHKMKPERWIKIKIKEYENLLKEVKSGKATFKIFN